MSKRRTQPDRSLEVLNKPVRMDGVGEDPAVRAMLSDEFVEGGNLEAVNIAMALQQIIRGQNALLNNQETLSGEISKIKQRMSEVDDAARRFEEDKAKFFQEVLDKAESLRDPTNRALVDGMNEYTDAVKLARAEAVTDKLQFIQSLKTMPKENVVSPGELVTVVEQNGQNRTIIMNEVVRIKGQEWIIPAGVVTEVPAIVAKVLRDRRRSEQGTQKREALLSQNLEESVLKTELAKLP